MRKIKKALIIFGSPHKDGKTAKVLGFLKNKIKDKFEFYTINAYEKNVKPCIDCGKCSKIGECIFDDLENLNYYFSLCDLVILASPIYNNSFPAPLKSIIDRTQRYYNFKKIIGHHYFKKLKKGIVILTAGSRDFKKDIISMQIEPVLKILNVVDISYIILENTDDKKLNIDKFLLKSENNIEDIFKNLI